MATVFPTPQGNAMVEQTPPPNIPHNGIRPPRQYTPYVFQPNFLKQQMKQQRLNNESLGIASGSNPSDNSGHTPQSGNQPMHLNLSHVPMNLAGTILDELNKKKGGRKVVDWASSCALYLQNRRFQRDGDDIPDLIPHTSYALEMQSVYAYRGNPMTSITSKFVRSATNKMKCPVYKVVWTPDGRRLVTGSASGEFTLWNGVAFNFETILQAHDSPVRAMAWSKHESWLITGDNQGYIKYWQLNMNNVKMYQAHKDQACRSVSFGPTDHKFVTASDDGTVRVWDFLRCHEERILRGHGADVKQVAWHPMKGIVASASKDLHTPVKLWDPKSGQSLITIHAHKGTVMDVKWNQNGNWLLSASRDHLVKLYDIRNLKQEMQVFRGHKKEAFSVSWHPIHENLFASGGSEGSILFWHVGEEKEAGSLEGAHDSLIWSLEWHPLGHVLVSGSNDHSTKFWTRSKPGDTMRDRYNQGLLPPSLDDASSTATGALRNNDTEHESSIIPGMGDADVAEAEVAKREQEEQKYGIPGLDWSYEEKNEFERKISTQHDRKKSSFARPVPRAFMAAWEANKEGRPDRDRPRSPRFREYERERDHRRWRERHADYPRDWNRGGPMRRGPDRPPSPGRMDDERVFVDGIEVGPDFDPDRIKSMPDNSRPGGPEHPPPPPPAFDERPPPHGPPLSPPRGRRLSDLPPPGVGSMREIEERRRIRDELYAELLRNGSERDLELLRELEEHGLPLEDVLEEDLFFDPNNERMRGMNELEGPGIHPIDNFPREHPLMDGRMGDLPPRHRGFPPGRDDDRFHPDRGHPGRGWRRSPPRMLRGNGPPR